MNEHRVIFKPGEGGRCTWHLEGKNNFVILVVKCPECGVDSTVSNRVHTIADDGTVAPSYVCPHTKMNGCKFHRYIRLDGWKTPDPRTV